MLEKVEDVSFFLLLVGATPLLQCRHRHFPDEGAGVRVEFEQRLVLFLFLRGNGVVVSLELSGEMSGWVWDGVLRCC